MRTNTHRARVLEIRSLVETWHEHSRDLLQHLFSQSGYSTEVAESAVASMLSDQSINTNPSENKLETPFKNAPAPFSNTSQPTTDNREPTENDITVT